MRRQVKPRLLPALALLAVLPAGAAESPAEAGGMALDGPLRQRPGAGAPKPYVAPEVGDPNSASGLERIAPPAPGLPGEFIPVPDRWRLAKDLELIEEKGYDPYNHNILKGDRPIFGRDWFLSVTGISDTVVEPRRFPLPVSTISSRRPGVLDQVGGGDQLVFNQNFILALVLFKGDTVFRPPDWEFRITPVFNINYVDLGEDRVVDIDPMDGSTRLDGTVALQELFVDKHLRNVSARYDFDSLRVGIQPFSTDFRGFLFQDNQLGVRLFGNRDNNLWQYNLAWFRRLEKDTNSGLNDITQRPREDDLFIANLYRQDFPRRGFTSQGIVLYNRNREGDAGRYFDDNGFQQRPAPLGGQRARNYDVVYVGYNGDGHFGRLNLTVSGYGVFGDQSTGVFRVEPTDVRAWFGAAELSVDIDWIRPRLSLLYASGDPDPYDSVAEGYDAVFENPIFAGADTSFWIRQAVPNIGGGLVTLSPRNGVLNALTPSKEHGQSNFANPGLQLYGLGADLDLLPELRVSINANKLFFDNTAVLEAALNQGPIDPDIGWDLSLSTIWRPLMSQNIVTRLSGALLAPGRGFEQLYGEGIAYSILANFVFTY